jgi:hypothetical protein
MFCDTSPCAHQLESGDSEARANSCAGIASLLCVEGALLQSNLQRLLSAGIIRKLLQRVCDPQHAVVLQALGALRSVPAACPP